MTKINKKSLFFDFTEFHRIPQNYWKNIYIFLLFSAFECFHYFIASLLVPLYWHYYVNFASTCSPIFFKYFSRGIFWINWSLMHNFFLWFYTTSFNEGERCKLSYCLLLIAGMFILRWFFGVLFSILFKRRQNGRICKKYVKFWQEYWKEKFFWCYSKIINLYDV